MLTDDAIQVGAGGKRAALDEKVRKRSRTSVGARELCSAGFSSPETLDRGRCQRLLPPRLLPTLPR